MSTVIQPLPSDTNRTDKKKVLTDIDIYDIYMYVVLEYLEIGTHLHTQMYIYTCISGRLMYVSHLVDFRSATLILT